MMVRDVMVEDATVVASDTTADAAAQIMADLDVGALTAGRLLRRMPVIDAERRLTGIVALDDLERASAVRCRRRSAVSLT